MRSTRRLFGISIALSLVVAACGDAAKNSNGTEPNGSFGTTTTALVKPTVSIPAEIPTELVVTDLIDGSGPAAAIGDAVIVNYVGVLSATGEEFDNSYGASPLDFYLGAGRVILGWDQGLVGVQQGTRRQLDVPADLAYGDSPPNGGSGLIKAGAALSFLVDVVVVLPTSTVDEQPQVTITPASNITVLESTELIVGEGATPEDGKTVAIQIMTFRADTGELLVSDWGTPPLTFLYGAQTNVYPGLLAAVKGMHVGGRRQAQIPFILMFDGQGNPEFGLPAETDLVVAIDLVAVY